MQPNEKKKRGKSANFLLNEGDYKEFSKIAKKLGYSNNEIINRLVSEFIKSNK